MGRVRSLAAGNPRARAWVRMCSETQTKRLARAKSSSRRRRKTRPAGVWWRDSSVEVAS